jgi:hypothetical protein
MNMDSYQHDAGQVDFGDGAGISVLQSTLYGLGSIWGAAYVVNHPQPPEESIMHLFVRLIPQMLFAVAAVIQAVIAYKKLQKKDK